jgi:hypothetical protein
VLTSTVWADALVDNPPSAPIRKGDNVNVMLISELLA